MERKEIIKEYKKLLYIVDIVKGFTTEGVMHDPYILNTVPHQLKLIEKFKNENEGIAFVKEAHTIDSTEFKNFPPHCIIGTSEAELIEELKPYEKDALVYPKNSTSAIFAPNVINDLDKMKNLELITAAGCCSDICLPNFLIPLKNYFNQNNRDIDIAIVKKASETYDSPIHNREEYSNMAYKLMEQSGIHVVEDIKELEYLEGKLSKERKMR